MEKEGFAGCAGGQQTDASARLAVKRGSTTLPVLSDLKSTKITTRIPNELLECFYLNNEADTDDTSAGVVRWLMDEV